MRIALGILLLANDCSDIFTRNPSVGSLVRVAVCLGLSLGFFTSIMGTAAAILSVWALFWGHTYLSLVQVATLIFSVVIPILGPGDHSIDALLFGRRHMIH